MAIMKRSVKGRFRAVDNAKGEESVGFHSIRLTFFIRLLIEPIIFNQLANSSYSYIASYVTCFRILTFASWLAMKLCSDTI